MIRNLKISLLVVIISMWVEVAQATILTFDEVRLSNYDIIPQTYGDNTGTTPNITVEYGIIDSAGNPNPTKYIKYWDTGYGDLNHVAWAQCGYCLGQITLIPEPGYSVTLNSFDLGGWGDRPNQTIRIVYDDQTLDYSPFLVEGSLTDGDGKGHSSFDNLGITSDGAIRIQFGNLSGGSGWIAVDNISFDQIANPIITTELAPVPQPEPASLLLLGFGLSGLGGISWRRAYHK